MQITESDVQDQERALVGWKAIADFLGCPVSTAMSKRHKFREAGIIFSRLQGSPPNRRRVIFTLPSLLRLYLMVEKKL